MEELEKRAFEYMNKRDKTKSIGEQIEKAYIQGAKDMLASLPENGVIINGKVYEVVNSSRIGCDKCVLSKKDEQCSFIGGCLELESILHKPSIRFYELKSDNNIIEE